MADQNAAARRRKAARLRSETDELTREIARDVIVESGLLDLVMYGQIRFVVVNRQLKHIYIEPSFEPKIPTPELALT